MGAEPGHLLMILHDKEERKRLSHHLKELGYKLTVAGDGDQALNLMKSQKPDLVLLDVNAPESGAQQILSAMKADELLCDTPAIILAPLSEMEAVAQCLTAGAEDYVINPFSPTLLKAQVGEYLQISRRRQEIREQAKQEELLKIERDVQIGRQIQTGFLPSELPQPQGWEIAARFYPAREVAGDWYDGFYMANKRKVGLVVADVCDKGVGAALFMALCRSQIRAFAQQHHAMSWMDSILDNGDYVAPGARRRAALSTGITPLKTALNLTNSYIVENHLDLCYFATVFFAVLDPASGALAYANCGHTPTILVDAVGRIKARLSSTGPAVGMFPDAEFEVCQTRLEPGDALFAFSDGVTDARNPGKEFFSDERLVSLIQQPAASATALLDRIDGELHAHIADAVPFDDITMLALRRVPQMKET
jgi:sigma-B regulation protein RsbU (phosphoserine phosphatase)